MTTDNDMDTSAVDDTEPAEPVRGRSWRQRQSRKFRRAARARIAERFAGPGCPRPDKPSYDREDVHERRIQERRLGPGMTMYDCRCGWSHNGHPLPQGVEE